MNNEQFFAAGGPAFPRVEDDAAWRGMSLRDWFAGMALQGMMANGEEDITRDETAAAAYAYADAMLAQRECGVSTPNPRIWRDIATAPLDGTEVLVCRSGMNARSASWMTSVEDGDGAWVIARSVGSRAVAFVYDAPEYWQPIPPPPSAIPVRSS